MRKHFNPLIIFVFIFLAFSSLPCAAAESRASNFCLRVEDAAGHAHLVKPVKDGDSFAIRFTHSVARSPVMDFYIVMDGKIILDKTVYQDFGAGLPHDTEEGQKMRVEGGEIILEGFNRELPDFDVRVGRIAKHALIFNPDGKNSQDRQEWPLADFVSPGSALHFSVSDNCAK